ncbi:alpha/beta hydrolase [Mitsuaria sp. WAJ17]|uniref:alpha/beta hydrolase n=1 Tax=Mitsuaria sp. WAJ17 TaxID=2761452 RepID=UPI0016014FD7|nr:alpha/beta hydrolase [Mitsuaria sp. WAJ17]MBB2487542.1 alpha/beta hydrolase [Mitsuaria sp. WAJ17]
MQLCVYFATNRGHEGPERFAPLRYGSRFSRDGMENLRFGRVLFDADDEQVRALLDQRRDHTGAGDGEALQDYLSKCVASSQRIECYRESIPDPQLNEQAQGQAVKLGSAALFAELQQDMQQGRDLMVLVHGFNVSWEEAVATAAAFEAMVNRAEPALDEGLPVKSVRVLLFTWPSDGAALPWASYKSDRADAHGTSGALGRALLKLRDQLHALGREVRQSSVRVRALRAAMAGLPNAEVERAIAQLEATELCGQKLHLLAHSMGNYVLQNALARVHEFSPGKQLPRLFDTVFLCAPDVDDDALEGSAPLARVHQVSQSVAIYHNRNDMALKMSDFTKGNPDRLGQGGAARPLLLHQKVYQVDCAALVTGLTQHSYYTNGLVARDIRLALSGLTPRERGLQGTGQAPNTWALVRRQA